MEDHCSLDPLTQVPTPWKCLWGSFNSTGHQRPALHLMIKTNFYLSILIVFDGPDLYHDPTQAGWGPVSNRPCFVGVLTTYLGALHLF